MASEASRELFLQQIADISDEFGIPHYEAFPRWICMNILGITDEGKIDEAVSIGGKGDYGIDIFHADEDGDPTEQYVCWIQAKFSGRLDRTLNRDEIEAFTSTLGHLGDCPEDANRTFKQKSAEFANMQKRNPRIQKRLILAVAGKVGDQVDLMIKNDRWRDERLGTDPDVHLEMLDLDRMLSRMTTPYTPTIKIKFDGGTVVRSDSTSGKKSVAGYVGASMLVQISKDHKETLFLQNPREVIGSSAPTHKATLHTLSNDAMRKRFWKLNNGVTAVCTALEAAGDESTYNVTNFKIVNGRQTAYTLERTTDPIDDVFLHMTIHESEDDEERNQISETTNTHNPIKPVDLVTNYPEMTELVLQCRKDFSEFYFERQTNGFKSAKKSTRQRVTSRRVMRKGSSARAYYAYSINPADATMSDRDLFSAAAAPNYYEQVFKDRKIKSLIIPHIFMQMLDELHRKWCKDLKGHQSSETSRNKGIISKDVVRYFILRFIRESMINMTGSERTKVEDNLIAEFRKLSSKDAMPDQFLNVAQAAYDTFMYAFDSDMSATWPKDLFERISRDGYEEQPEDVPSPDEIMSVLRNSGGKMVPLLIRLRKHVLKMHGDMVKARLLEV